MPVLDPATTWTTATLVVHDDITLCTVLETEEKCATQGQRIMVSTLQGKWHDRHRVQQLRLRPRSHDAVESAEPPADPADTRISDRGQHVPADTVFAREECAGVGAGWDLDDSDATGRCALYLHLIRIHRPTARTFDDRASDQIRTGGETKQEHIVVRNHLTPVFTIVTQAHISIGLCWYNVDDSSTCRQHAAKA